MFSKKNLLFIIFRNSIKAIIVAVLSFTIIFVARGQITKISKSILEKKAGSLTLEKRSGTTEQLRRELNLIGENESKIENALPSIDSVPDVLAGFQSAADQVSIHISVGLGTNPMPYNSETNIKVSSIDYNATLNGNIETLIRFLNTYEHLPFLTSITSISIVSPPQGWTANSQITIPGKIFIKEND